MSDRHFFWLLAGSLAAVVVMALLGVLFQSLGLILDILLALVGVVAGYLISSYFDSRARKQNLGLHASSGYRISSDVNVALGEIIDKTGELKELVADESRISKRNVLLMLDVISGKLEVLRHVSLSAAIQWTDVMSSEQKRQLEISNERDVRLIEEKHLLQRGQASPQAERDSSQGPGGAS